MKKYFYLLLFFILAITACNVSDSEGDENINWLLDGRFSPDTDVNISDSLKSILKLDAERLAFADLISDTSLKLTLIKLPANDVEKYYRGLVRIFNARNYVPFDKIYIKRFINTFPYISLNNLSISFDTTIEWTQAWINGQLLTGNSDIDYLIETYSLSLGSRYYNYITLTSSESYNLFALGKKFENIAGVLCSAPDRAAGDGNNITAKTLNEGGLYYIYRVGWGDCPAGCINSHFWDVLASPDGKVTFIKEYGVPLE